MERIRAAWSWIRGPKWAKPKHSEDLDGWPEEFEAASRQFLQDELRSSVDMLDRALSQIEGRVVQIFQVSVLLVTASGLLGGQGDATRTTQVLAAVAIAVATVSWWSALEAFRPRRLELGTNVPDLTREHAGADIEGLRMVSMEVLRDQAEDWNQLRDFRSHWLRRQLGAVMLLALLTALVALLR